MARCLIKEEKTVILKFKKNLINLHKNEKNDDEYQSIGIICVQEFQQVNYLI